VAIAGRETDIGGTTFRETALAGTTLTLIGDCNVTLSGCDLSYCPREIIKLVNCPNDVQTTDCKWPSSQMVGLEILIWDEDDDPPLGNVIY